MDRAGAGRTHFAWDHTVPRMHDGRFLAKNAVAAVLEPCRHDQLRADLAGMVPAQLAGAPSIFYRGNAAAGDLSGSEFKAPLPLSVFVVNAMDCWTTRRRLEAAIELMKLQDESAMLP